MKSYLNYNRVYNYLIDLCNDALDEMGDLHDNYDDYVEEYAAASAESIIADMDRYIHQPDKTILGNFNKIDRDWNSKHEQSFDDMVKSVDNETISEQELDYVQEWCFDWFLDTFGTFGLKYNFESSISENEMEYEYEEI